VFEDAKYAICTHSLDVDDIWARWKVGSRPTPSRLARRRAPVLEQRDGLRATVKKVHIGYFKPTASLPNGRYVVWIENPNQILEDTAWPYPTHDLPLVKFPGVRMPGSIYDGAYVEQAIPLQKELNRTLSQIVEYKNLTIKPRVWAPTGSVRTRLTSEPGGLYEYNPIGGFKPEIEQLPTMPPYVFEHLKEIAARLKEVFALTEISEGGVPPNVEAGIAIDLLQELAADRLAPTIKLIERSIARAGRIMLSLAQKYYIEPRQMRIIGSGGSVQVQKFNQADIAGGVTIRVETGSGLPRTRAGRQAQIERWIDKGIIPPDKAWKYVDSADLKGLAAQFQADDDQANREIEKIERGEPINPEALAQAKATVQQGTNPQTQQPFQNGSRGAAVPHGGGVPAAHVGELRRTPRRPGDLDGQRRVRGCHARDTSAGDPALRPDPCTRSSRFRLSRSLARSTRISRSRWLSVRPQRRSSWRRTASWSLLRSSLSRLWIRGYLTALTNPTLMLRGLGRRATILLRPLRSCSTRRTSRQTQPTGQRTQGHHARTRRQPEGAGHGPRGGAASADSPQGNGRRQPR
jgi:hypothetical protein